MTKTELKENTAKIKKLLKQRDYGNIDTGIELARALDEPAVFEALLGGCSIDKEGKLISSKMFTGTGPAQPFLNYAMLNLIAYAPENTELDESLKLFNIKLLNFVQKPLAYGALPFTDLVWTDLPSCIACFTNLTSLDLSNCLSLQNLDVLANLTNLTSLSLYGCKSLQNVDVLANLTNLNSLDLGDCDYLQNVDVLANLTNLTSLTLYKCTSLQNVDGLANLTNLSYLALNNCYGILPEPSKKWNMTTREEVAAYQVEIGNAIK